MGDLPFKKLICHTHLSILSAGNVKVRADSKSRICHFYPVGKAAICNLKRCKKAQICNLIKVRIARFCILIGGRNC